MRIAFFVWEYPPSIAGGLGTYSQYMAPNLVKQGHDVTIFTLNRAGLPTREIMEGVEVHRPLIADASKAFSLIVDHNLLRWGAGLRFFSDIMLYNILSATKLLNDLIIKEGYKFDLVSYHDWLSSTAGIVMKSNSELPCVFHVHSTEGGRTNGQGSEVVTKIERAAASEADRIITVSHAMKEDLASHGWPRDQIDAVWNGIDPERYDPEKCTSEEVRELRKLYQIGEDENMVLFVGRLSPVKGVQCLIQAMPAVLHQCPKTNLVVLGSGDLE